MRCQARRPAHPATTAAPTPPSVPHRWRGGSPRNPAGPPSRRPYPPPAPHPYLARQPGDAHRSQNGPTSARPTSRVRSPGPVRAPSTVTRPHGAQHLARRARRTVPQAPFDPVPRHGGRVGENHYQAGSGSARSGHSGDRAHSSSFIRAASRFARSRSSSTPIPMMAMRCCRSPHGSRQSDAISVLSS